MEIIAELKIEGIEPVRMTYSNLKYIVTYCDYSEEFCFYDEAELSFKNWVDVALDDYR